MAAAVAELVAVAVVVVAGDDGGPWGRRAGNFQQLRLLRPRHSATDTTILAKIAD